jgi:hypothetical protein
MPPIRKTPVARARWIAPGRAENGPDHGNDTDPHDIAAHPAPDEDGRLGQLPLFHGLGLYKAHGRPVHARGSLGGMFCADHAQWSLLGCGALMIEHRDTGECLGQVGINHGPLFPEWELGWLVYPEAEGHGFAFEAATALRAWARETRKLETLVSYIDPANLRSIRLAERLGATLDPQAARPDPGDLVYRHFEYFSESATALR